MDQESYPVSVSGETPASVTGLTSGPKLGVTGRQPTNSKLQGESARQLGRPPGQLPQKVEWPGVAQSPKHQPTKMTTRKTLEVVDLTKELDFNLHHMESTDIPESPQEGNSPPSESFGQDHPPKRRKMSLLEGLQRQRKMSEQNSRLVDSEFPQKKDAYFNIFEEEQANFSKPVLGKRKPLDVIDFAKEFGGTVVNQKRTLEGTKVSFTCRLNHRFSSIFPHNAGHDDNCKGTSWCRTCTQLFEKAKRFADSQGGELVSDQMNKVLEFKCSAGHSWSISYKKSQRSWCNRCKKAKRKLQKERLAQKRKTQEYQRMCRQEKMLQEAKERMLRQQGNQKAQTGSNSSDQKAQVEAYMALQSEIDKIAGRYAQEYIGKYPEGQYESVLTLYRVLIMPQSNLRDYL